MTALKTNWNNWNPLQRNKFWNSESPIDYVTEIKRDNNKKRDNTGKRPGIIF